MQVRQDPLQCRLRTRSAGWWQSGSARQIWISTVVRLSAEVEFREIVSFHAQQAAEKYLKALLTRHQIEFPKTHVIRRLLILLEPIDPAMVRALDEASWLSPFGAEIRYPGDRAETLPGVCLHYRTLLRNTQDLTLALNDRLGWVGDG